MLKDGICDMCGGRVDRPVAAGASEPLCKRCEGRLAGRDEERQERQRDDLNELLWELVGDYGPDRTQLLVLDHFESAAQEWRRREDQGIENGPACMRQLAIEHGPGF